MNNWLVYIVRCSDGTLYTGCTNDLNARLKAHNAGKGAKYIWSRRPVTLVYKEEVGSQGDALRREAEVKRLNKNQKKKLVRDHGLEVTA